MQSPENFARPPVSTHGYFGQLHTPGLLRLGRVSTIVADHPVPGIAGSDNVEDYGGHLVGESITRVNARRLVACWNACATVHTDALEDGFVEKVREDRNFLLGETVALQGQLRTALTQVDLLGMERDVLLEFARAVRSLESTLGHPEASAADENAAEARYTTALKAVVPLLYPQIATAVAVPAEAAVIGAQLDAESIEQGEPA